MVWFTANKEAVCVLLMMIFLFYYHHCNAETGTVGSGAITTYTSKNVLAVRCSHDLIAAWY